MVCILDYSQTSLSQIKWDWLKTLRYGVFDISRVNYLKYKKLGLTNHFDITIVFEISVSEISKFNSIIFC